MYLLHRKNIDIYANISTFLSYSEVTVATRSGTYPAQMITAVNRSRPYPDYMVDHHLETTSIAPNVSREGHLDEQQRQIPSEDLVTKTAIGKRPLEPVEFLQSEFAAVGTNYWFVWPEGIGPPTEPGFSQGFFLRSVTDRVLVPCRCQLWLA